MENLFNLHRGKFITVKLKQMEEGYFTYKGILIGKENDFVYLMDGEVYFTKAGKNETVFVSKFNKVAINKSLVATVEFP